MTITLTVAAVDVADALAIAWDAFGSAARDDLTGWEVTAAAAEVQPKPPLTGASGHHRPAFIHPQVDAHLYVPCPFGSLTRPGGIYRRQLATGHNPGAAGALGRSER